MQESLAMCVLLCAALSAQFTPKGETNWQQKI